VDDRQAVIEAVRDYWDGWFEGDPARMERALHPALSKRGVGLPGHEVTAPMTAPDMVGWTREGEGVATRPADSGYDIAVNDLYHDIATVTVTSAIYREYLHLARTAEGWRILAATYTNVRD
jgi:hypothetical protein